MKLSDLMLTPAGAAATAKLAHQTHKTTIAAGGEPTLKLGILGIVINQEQSTGDTSKPAFPMPKYRPRKNVTT